MDDELTHFDGQGAARMVAIADKAESARHAVARARVVMHAETLAKVEAGQHAKGDVLGIARIAGISGSKLCAQSIPLCHPVRITSVDIRFAIDPVGPAVDIEAEVHAIDRTGPEMEAMSAATTAALTIYDMCKAVDRGMRIVEVALVSKSGGKSGHWQRSDP